MALNQLARDVQEQLLFLPRVTEREPEISEKMLRSINMLDDWEEQRYLFRTKETVEEI